LNLSGKELIALAEIKEKWTYMGRWLQPTLSMCFWPLWGHRRTYNDLGLPPIPGYNLQLDGHYVEFNPDFQVIEQACLEACEKHDDSFFRQYVKTAERTCRNHLDLAGKLDSKKSPLKETLKAFFDSTNQLVVPWIAVFPVGMGVDKALSKQLKKEGIRQIELLSHFEPPKPTMLMQQERQAREFAEYVRDAGVMHVLEEPPEKIMDVLSINHEQLANRISSHLEEFEWVGTHHCWGEPLTADRLFTQIKEMPPKKEEKEEMKKISEELQWLIRWQNELAYWRQYCAETSDVGFFKARSVLNEAAAQLELSYEEIIWLSDQEILKGLENATIPSKDELKARERGFGLTEGFADDEIIITGEKLEHLKRILIPTVDTTVQEFVGTVGSKGLVIGKAFVAFTPQEAAPMQKGSVLVVPQTTPDYVVVMKKAKAIVTDEGGMTCHAAVVSRELGVPCVVGTKVATRVLKTGDLIEVDAHSGIIRRIRSGE